MAKKGNRQIIKLHNPKTGTAYYATKNRVNVTEKLEMKKFDPKTGKHENFVEKKLK
ncbi:MAG: 50S ribosomal protein L33 [Candidatus Dojkabacteria bacterium]